jgi:hypothetical protein
MYLSGNVMVFDPVGILKRLEPNPVFLQQVSKTANRIKTFGMIKKKFFQDGN